MTGRDKLARLRARVLADQDQDSGPAGHEPRAPNLPSFAQERFWFLAQARPRDASYNVPIGIRLRGPLSADAVRTALRAIVSRHEVLRTRYVSSPLGCEPVVARPDGTFLDLPTHPVMDVLAARAFALGFARTPFDLAEGPPIRAALLRFDDDHHLLLLCMHHIAVDDESVILVLAELGHVLAGHPLPAAAPPRYAEYAARQRRRLSGPELNRQLGWWRDRLRNAEPLALAVARDGTPMEDDGGPIEFTLTAGTAGDLRRVARDHRTTLFVVVLATLLVVLRRYSGQTDICVGTPVSIRDLDESHELDLTVGPFLNTIVLRTNLSEVDTFVDLVRHVRGVLLETLPYRETPYERVTEVVGRELAYRRPLFQVLFSLGSEDRHDLGWPVQGLEARQERIPLDMAKAALALHLRERYDGALSGTLQFDPAEVDRDTAQRMTAHLHRLANTFAGGTTAPLADAEMFSADEHHRLSAAWNDPPVSSAASHNDDLGVHELFVQRAEQHPEASAVAQGSEVLTYGEVNRWSAAIASELLDEHEFVAICVPRGVAAIVAVMGVLRAGRAYLPLDADFPAVRLRFALEDTGARTVLVYGQVPDTLLAAVGDMPDPPRLLDLQSCTKAREVPPAPGGERSCYVIYTSGTTGAPKGVVLEHRALTHYSTAMAAALREALDQCLSGLNFATVSTMAADLGNTCIFPALISGGCVHVLDHDTATDPDRFSQYLHDHAIDVLKIVPSHFEALHHAASSPRLPRRALVLGGESPSRALVAALTASPVTCRIFNHYGPTETCVGSLLFAVPGRVDPARPLPVGRPLGKTRIAILDGQGAPVPMGVTGELYIGGPGVARHYLNQPELTEQRFVTVRGISGEPLRYYRTGDLVRTRADGAIEFIGRADTQVKIRGHRVEPREVESVIVDLTGASQVLVIARAEGLAAFVVGEFDRADLETRLRVRLPAHMVPTSITAVGEIPRTPNGKPDLVRLNPAEQASTTSAPPRDSWEARLLVLWAELLGQRIERTDQDFFAAGGHSLMLIRLVGRVRTEFGLEIRIRDCIENPTVQSLAAVLRRADPAAVVSVVPRSAGSLLTASFAQERLWFMHKLYPRSAGFVVPVSIRLRGDLDSNALCRAVRSLVTRHEVLRTAYVRRHGGCAQVIMYADGDFLTIGAYTASDNDDAIRHAMALVNQPFDLAEPPVRADLVRIADDDHLLVMAMHHIAVDGWSVGVLSRELGMAYRATSSGAPLAAPPALQFADFAAWQRAELDGDRLPALLSWWRDRLTGAEVLRLPTDRPRPEARSDSGDVVTFDVDARTGSALRRIGGKQNATPFVVMLSVFAVVLAELTGQHDLSIGTVVSGRPLPELDDTVGPFVNTVVLRLDNVHAPTFPELVGRARRVVLDALAHQDAPFEKVVETVNPPRDVSRTPLFQVAFGSGPPGARTVDWSVDGLRAEPVVLPFTMSKYDMTLDTEEQPDGSFRCRWHYATALYAKSSIDAMAERFLRLAREFADEIESG